MPAARLITEPEDKVLVLEGPRSKKDRAYDVIKRRILANEYTPGMPIVEYALSRELEVSKTPIREALQQLERDGLIETVPGRGSFVTHITIEDIREVFESREIIECGVARRVALIGDKDLIRFKKQEFESLISGGVSETPGLSERDDVHIFIFTLLGNRKLSFVYTQFLDQIIRLRNYFKIRVDAERTAQYDQEHLSILEALIRGDPDKAEEATQAHLRNAVTYLTRLISL